MIDYIFLFSKKVYKHPEKLKFQKYTWSKMKHYQGVQRLKTSVCLVMIILIGSLFVSGCGKMVKEKELAPLDVGPQLPANIQPATLQPGLSVLYFNGFYRHINEMPKGKHAIKKGEPGLPITILNHRFGNGKVFDSNRSSGVGMQMNGYLHLKDPGRYLFKAISNDGIEVFIGSKTIISDPRVHKDRDSLPGEIEALKAGWFPVMVRYFQRKGTATLELHWQTPGADNFSIVPKNIYAHLVE